MVYNGFVRVPASNVANFSRESFNTLPCGLTTITDADYLAFEKVLEQTVARVPVRVLAYCIMPNHFHLVLLPRRDRASLLAACKSVEWLEQVPAARKIQRDLMTSAFEVKDGFVGLPTEPGLGVRLTEEHLRKYPFVPGTGERT